MSTSPQSPQGTAGSAAYTPLSLRLYDAWVLQLSNLYAWRCPTSTVLLPFFAAHLSRNHLDVGVGTGYYPSAALSSPHFRRRRRHDDDDGDSSSSVPPPPPPPYPVMSLPLPQTTNGQEDGGDGGPQKITFMDLNTTALETASKLVQKAHPSVQCTTVHADVLSPLPAAATVGTFDSISVIYLLHCLAGPMAHKIKALRVLKRHLSPRGVLYGATILGRGPRRPGGTGKDGNDDDDDGIERLGWFAWVLLQVYNWKGIFGNWDDGPDVLAEALEAEFEEVETRIVGRVFLWVARTPRED